MMDSPPETILVVEDEDTVRRVTARLLQRLGYAVTTAASAEEAITLHEGRAAPFALILTDVVMPGLTGIELAEVLRKREPDVRILFMSGYPSRELGQNPDDPPSPFLPKPFSVDELGRMVRMTLHS